MFFISESGIISGSLSVPTITMVACSKSESIENQSQDEVRLNPSRCNNNRKSCIVRSTYEVISDNNDTNDRSNNNSDSNSNNHNSNNRISNLLLQNTGCRMTHWNSTPLLFISWVFLFSAIIVVLRTKFYGN